VTSATTSSRIRNARRFQRIKFKFARSIPSGVTAMAIAAACAPAYAGEEWPDGPNKDFFQNLLRPGNHERPHQDPSARSCCRAADIVVTKFKVSPNGQRDYSEDQWHAWLGNSWELIPPDKIVPGHAPDGQAYLFIWGATSAADYDPVHD
jgi:hypothetical protein